MKSWLLFKIQKDQEERNERNFDEEGSRAKDVRMKSAKRIKEG